MGGTAAFALTRPGAGENARDPPIDANPARQGTASSDDERQVLAPSSEETGHGDQQQPEGQQREPAQDEQGRRRKGRPPQQPRGDDDGDGRDDVATGTVTRWTALVGPSLRFATHRSRELPRYWQLDGLVGLSASGDQSGPIGALDLSYQFTAMRVGVRSLKGGDVGPLVAEFANPDNLFDHVLTFEDTPNEGPVDVEEVNVRAEDIDAGAAEVAAHLGAASLDALEARARRAAARSGLHQRDSQPDTEGNGSDSAAGDNA